MAPLWEEEEDPFVEGFDVVQGWIPLKVDSAGSRILKQSKRVMDTDKRIFVIELTERKDLPSQMQGLEWTGQYTPKYAG